jgi:hypothetical protein
MPATTRLFRVPCRCSAAVTILPGQAGSRVICPACGAGIEVPRLRDLAPFAVVAERSSGWRWSAAHGWLLVGVVVAAAAAIAAGLIGSFDGGAARRLPSERVIREVIESSDAATIHAAWRSLRQSSVDRGAMPAELLVQRAAGSASRIAKLLWAVATLAGLVALGGAVAAARQQAAASPGGTR